MRLIPEYPLSLWHGYRQRGVFANVETFCLFIGYPRSGHSLIGGLLDAHPHAVIAHECGAVKYAHARFNRWQIYWLLLQNARRKAAAGRLSGAYSFAVPGQWQGRFQQIRVIGDKRGQGATLRLRARPWLLERLQATVAAPVRFIHVVRNPYDNIATLLRKTPRLRNDLAVAIEHYFALSETVLAIQRQVGQDAVFELRHEAFVAAPAAQLRQLCHFLGLDPAEHYLRDCASIVYRSPHRSRHGIEWPPALVDRVAANMQPYPFLAGYTFDD